MMEKEFNIEMVKNVLKNIANKNHFFVSEAHLRTEFIIMSAKLYPNNKYYPELVPSKIPTRYLKKHAKDIRFDLLIKTSTQKVLVEFKYVTCEYANTVDGMEIKVKNHMAFNMRRYDCWRDIERIETFSKSKESDVDYGYFVLITNVCGLWNKQKSNNSLDIEFCVDDGIHKSGERNWKKWASKGTTKGRELPIKTSNDYNFKYDPFYDFKDSQKYGEFKSLVVEID